MTPSTLGSTQLPRGKVELADIKGLDIVLWGGRMSGF